MHSFGPGDLKRKDVPIGGQAARCRRDRSACNWGVHKLPSDLATLYKNQNIWTCKGCQSMGLFPICNHFCIRVLVTVSRFMCMHRSLSPKQTNSSPWNRVNSHGQELQVWEIHHEGATWLLPQHLTPPCNSNHSKDDEPASDPRKRRWLGMAMLTEHSKQCSL